MLARICTALSVAMLIAVQPVFAQESVIILDLEYATDEELSGALDVATELELIMRTEWDPYDEGYPTEEPEYVAQDYAEEPAEEQVYVAEVEEPDYPAEEQADVAYHAEEPEYVAEVEEPGYYPAEEQAYVVYYADEPEYEAEYLAYYAEEPEYVAEEPIPATLDNRYFQESQRLVALAEEAYERGDYEAAAAYAQEASRYAMLSDEYIARHAAEEEAVAEAVVADEDRPTLPATFTVRSWANYRDCLWNIAALPEVYGDPRKWPVLFNANRHRMPNPNNPDLILPGMVLEIPSIDGEVREGAWQNR